MVTLFSEFYEADACIETAGDRTSEISRQVDSLRVYQPILAHHGYTREDFRTSLEYYLRRPDDLSSIFDKVHARMVRNAEEAERQAAALKAEEEVDVEVDVEEGLEGVEKEDMEPEVSEPDAVDTVRVADTVKVLEPVRPADEVKPIEPAVDSQPAPEQKSLRKKVTRKDLKRLEEELKK